MEILKTYKLEQLSEDDLSKLILRNADPLNQIEQQVQTIIHEVRSRKDQALLEYAEQWDKVKLNKLYLEKAEIEALALEVPRDKIRALEIAFANIHRFHSLQMKKERKIETMPGVTCWRESRPIERVGLYVPGGTAVLPSTLLMLGVPARLAGCKEIIVCTPPRSDGKISPFIAYCLYLLKIEKVYLIGGAQAIAAMTYGTESVPGVDKIFGPGNQYVTKAKTLIQQQSLVSIDIPAGPSEVLVIADKTADPAFVAADLLAQAEHGVDSQSILVTDDAEIIARVNSELKKQLKTLPRADLAGKALHQSYAILAPDIEQAMRFSNRYAPEHLILEIEEWQAWVPRIINAGSVFLGHYSPESVGDYASGTNHTLPTSGYARSYSGVSVDSFVKKITFQNISSEGIRQIGPIVETLADMEGLEGHKRSVSIRLQKDSAIDM